MSENGTALRFRYGLALALYLIATPIVWLASRIDPDAPSASWKELL